MADPTDREIILETQLIQADDPKLSPEEARARAISVLKDKPNELPKTLGYDDGFIPFTAPAQKQVAAKSEVIQSGTKTKTQAGKSVGDMVGDIYNTVKNMSAEDIAGLIGDTFDKKKKEAIDKFHSKVKP